MNGACAFADGALFLAGSFAAWTAFAVAGVALDSAIASAFGAVFHICVVFGWTVGAGLEDGGEWSGRMRDVRVPDEQSGSTKRGRGREREKGEGKRVSAMQTVVLILILGKQWASNEQNDQRCFLFRISTTKRWAHNPPSSVVDGFYT